MAASLPGPGEKFLLISAHNGDVFCSGTGKHSNGNDRLGHCKGNDVSEDCWWTLQPSRASGFFLIAHFGTNRRLYVNIEREECGLCSDEYYQHDDQLWKIQPNPDNKLEVQLYNYEKYKKQKNKLFLRDHSRPYIGLVPGNAPNDRDQYFNFGFGQPVVMAIDFQLDQATFVGKEPLALAQQTYSNNTSVEQEQTFTTRYKQTQEHSFKYTGGFKIKADMSLNFKGAIPQFGIGGTFKLGAETDHHWTTGKVRTESNELEYVFPLKVPAGKVITARILIHEEKAEVPYEMTIALIHVCKQT